MSLNWFIIILWFVLTIWVLAFPAKYFAVYVYAILKKLYNYIIVHSKELTALAKFKNNNFVHKIHKAPIDDHKIFEDSETQVSLWKQSLQKQIVSSEEDVNKDKKTQIQLSDEDKDKHEIRSDENLWENENKTEVLMENKTKETSNNAPLDHRIKQKIDLIKSQATSLLSKWKHDEYEKKIIEGIAIEEKQNWDFTKMLADRYFHLWKYTKALTLLKQILSIEPKHHRSLRQVAEIHLEKWDFETAKILIDKAITLSPQDPKYYVTLVEVYYNMGNIEVALKHMNKVCQLRPNNVNYLMWLAWLYEEVKDIAEAKKYYLRVVHLDPGNEIAKKKVKLF